MRHRDDEPLQVAAAVLAPALSMLAVHALMKSRYSRSSDPHLEACTEFGVPPTTRALREMPTRLLTHMWVHRNDGHVLTNVISLTFAMAEFGPANSGIENLTRGSAADGLFRAIAATAVMTIGSIVGGIPATIFDASRQSEKLKQKHGFGVPLIETVIGKVADLQKGWTIMCGASAGITALSGFNASYYGKYVSGGICMVQVVLAAVGDPTAQEPSLFSFGSARVGHAAHVGGFVCGLVLGLAVRRLKDFYDRRRGVGVVGRRLGGW